MDQKLDGLSFRDVPASVWSGNVCPIGFQCRAGLTRTEIMSSRIRLRRHGHGAGPGRRRATFVWRAATTADMRPRGLFGLFPGLHAGGTRRRVLVYGREE